MARKSFEQDDAVALIEAVAAGKRRIEGTTGDDRLIGDAGTNSFVLRDGGDDEAIGLAGNDRFYFGDSFTSADRVDGGEGRDVVFLQGRYEDGIVLSADALQNVEKVLASAGATYNIEILDGFESLRIQPGRRVGGSTLNVDGSALATGHIRVVGGGFGEEIVGGSRNDILRGGLGADTLTGGKGADRFLYESRFESESKTFGVDTITDFGDRDRIRLPGLSSGNGYHIGLSENRTGDILVSYDSDSGTTSLTIFTNADQTADMTIFSVGDHQSLRVLNDLQLVEFL